MRLKSLRFSEYAGGRMHWSFDRLDLGDTNLIVGMNASGKTKTLNVINGFASLLSGRRKQVFVSGDYAATFTDARKPRDCSKYFARVVDSGIPCSILFWRNFTTGGIPSSCFVVRPRWGKTSFSRLDKVLP